MEQTDLDSNLTSHLIFTIPKGPNSLSHFFFSFYLLIDEKAVCFQQGPRIMYVTKLNFIYSK